MSERGAHFTITCSACNRAYKVQETDIGPWNWQQVDIECPYCKNVHTRKSSGSFKTTKIEND